MPDFRDLMGQSVTKYKHMQCYSCGQPLIASSFNDVWTMRVDGVPHQVPLWSVPCSYCTACDIAITDGGSDEAIEWSYEQYLTEAGLNTPYLRVRRVVRRFFLGIRNRILRDYQRSMRTLKRATT
jgi:hypothetical protein